MIRFTMEKTLILVIDRDNDYGEKAGVVSPVIGYEECKKAALALGIADPEDSDTNGLLGALHLYNELAKERGHEGVEVALLCGDKKVGHLSDKILVQQLESVLEEVRPDNAHLVSDGAEDEYIGPIIRSRISIDHVERVIVQQTPRVENTIYMLKRVMDDPEKRQRFLGPISWVLAGLGLLFLVSNFAVAESFNRFLAISIIPLFVFAIGLILAFYSYNLADRINDWFDRWKQRASHGSIQLVFVVAGGLVGIVGFVISLFSVGEVYTERTTQAVVLFLINFLWFAVFAVLIYVFGAILDGYIYSRKLRYIFITIILNMVSIGLIANGILDYLMAYVGLYHTDNLIIIVEIVAGFMMTIVAAALQVKVRKIYYSSVPSDKGNPVNEVQ